MTLKERHTKALRKKADRGFAGYPVATVAYYGPDDEVNQKILLFIRSHGAKSVVLADRIIGCPHEEGIDYPEGGKCPQCPFWAYRDRWSGEIEH